MMRSKWVGLMVVAALVAAPALAGGYEKCDHPTQDCLDYMAKKMKNSGWVGVNLEFDDAAGGYALEKVIAGSPAETAGLRAGDIIVAINEVNADGEKSEKMWKTHKSAQIGDTIVWSVKRGGTDRKIEIVLAPMPADMLAKYIGEHMIQHTTVEVAEAETAD